MEIDNPTELSEQCQYMFARKSPRDPVHQCTAKAKYGERYCWRHLKYRNLPMDDFHTRQTKGFTV